MHGFLVCNKTNLEQLGQNILLFQYITGGFMKNFYPFLYKKKEKKEPTPLYVELVPPVPEKEEDPSKKEEEPGVIIIELF